MDLTNIINLLILVLLTAFATMVTSEVYSDDVDLEQFSELFSKRDAVEGECNTNIKHLMTGPMPRETVRFFFFFHENLNVSRGRAKENIEIRGKQNELFPEGPVFK